MKREEPDEPTISLGKRYFDIELNSCFLVPLHGRRIGNKKKVVGEIVVPFFSSGLGNKKTNNIRLPLSAQTPTEEQSLVQRL